MKIEIIPYSHHWIDEFCAIGQTLRGALGDDALRIDHIGSTSVPELSAKDVIDVQVTVASLDPVAPFIQAFQALGYDHLAHITGDHIPFGASARQEDWRKLIFVTQTGRRRANVHVRIAGKPNQQYPLLFRDYLRAHPAAAQGYAEVKRQLARHNPDNMDVYYDVKDPVCDIIMAGAHLWAAASNWGLGPSDA